MKVAKIYYNSNSGFNAIFTNLIHSLTQVKKYGFYPIIEWYSSTYSDDINENIFYKYFELKIKPHENEDLDYSDVITVSPYQLRENRISWRKILCDAYSTYIDVKPFVIARVNQIFSNPNIDIDTPFIGVHIRNTDRIIEQAYASPGIQYVINRLIDVLKEYKCKNTHKIGLYIASDNIPDVDLLKKTLASAASASTSASTQLPLIIYIEDPNCVRSPNQTSVHGDFDEGIKTATKEEKALSILTDIYSLAKCEKIVKTCSNVTAMVGIISPKTEFIDVSIEHGKQSDEWLLVPGI